MDEIITYDDVELPAGRLADELRAEQEKLFPELSDRRRLHWQILITTIPHRHDKLCALLEYLDAQMRPGVGVLLCRDEHLAGYRPGLQALMDAATAEYVSAIADDDTYSPDAIPRITAALETRPDYVGFRVRLTENGVRRIPCHPLPGLLRLERLRPVGAGIHPPLGRGVQAGPHVREPGPPGARAAGAVPRAGLRRRVGR